jgi:hypothetical protein
MMAVPVDMRTGDRKLDDRIEEVMSRLLFINKIRPQTKIEVSTLKLRSTGQLDRLYRWWFTPEENKETSYGFLKSTFEEAFTVITLLQHHENKSYSQHIIEAIVVYIQNALSGLPKLAETYRTDDGIFVSKLQTLGDIIQIKLKDMKLTTSDKTE